MIGRNDWAVSRQHTNTTSMSNEYGGCNMQLHCGASADLVRLERSVDGGQILLVVLEQLEESIQSAHELPPALVLQQRERAAQDVAHVGSAAHVGRKGALHNEKAHMQRQKQ